LLALWDLHGLREPLHDAWQYGVVLAGVSAGSVCWFAGGTTDAFGPELRPVRNGLGFLPYANSPHHDAEPLRRPAITRLLEEEALPECYATDNGTALVFQDTTLVEAVTEKPGATAWQLRRRSDGRVEDTELPTRLLPPW
jgi:peptidase E